MNEHALPPAAGKGLSDVQRAARVARFVEIIDVRLLALDARATSDRPVLMAPEIRLDHSATCHRTEDGSRLVVIAIFDAVATSAGADSHVEEIGRVHCEFLLEYEFSPPPDMPASADDVTPFLAAFGSVNGIFNAWPYMREILHSTWARMGVPPAILPVYRVPAPAKRRAE